MVQNITVRYCISFTDRVQGGSKIPGHILQMFNFAVYGATNGGITQPPGSFNLAHIYPTSKIKQVVDLTYNNWNDPNARQDLWNLIDWLYLIDPNAFVKVLPLRLAPLVPAIPFNGKIFL